MTDTGNWWQDTIVANPMLWDETIMGIDWGEGTNAYAIVGYRGRVLVAGFVDETPQGVRQLLDALRAHAQPLTGHLPPVAIESPRRLLVWASKNAGVTVVALNPKSVKTARGLKNPRNGAKTDPKDAILIANVLRNNPTYYRALAETSEHARAITLLHRARGDAVTAAVRQANRVRSALAEYHPNAVRAFTVEQMGDNLAAYHVLGKALTPQQGAKLTKSRIHQLLMRPGGRKSTKGLDNLIDQVQAALREPALSYSPQFETAFAETVRTDLEVLKSVVEHRVAVDRRLREAVQQHPMWDMFQGATGAGEAVVGGLIAEVGDDPQRFQSAEALQAFAGSAPTIDQSGGRSNVKRRDTKGNRLHQAMWYWSGSVVMQHPAAKTLYWTLRKKGAAHPHAMRKIMNKLIRGVQYCLQTGTVWDDDRIWDPTITKESADLFATEVRDMLKARKATGKKSVQSAPSWLT